MTEKVIILKDGAFVTWNGVGRAVTYALPTSVRALYYDGTYVTVVRNKSTVTVRADGWHNRIINDAKLAFNAAGPPLPPP